MLSQRKSTSSTSTIGVKRKSNEHIVDRSIESSPKRVPQGSSLVQSTLTRFEDSSGSERLTGKIIEVTTENFCKLPNKTHTFNNKYNVIEYKDLFKALLFVLGARAADISSRENYENLIANNCEKVTVSLILYNKGYNAYQPNIYGNIIRISKTVKRNVSSISSVYNILNMKGESVLTPHKVLCSIREHFNIYVKCDFIFVDKVVFSNLTGPTDFRTANLDQYLNKILIKREKRLANSFACIGMKDAPLHKLEMSHCNNSTDETTESKGGQLLKLTRELNKLEEQKSFFNTKLTHMKKELDTYCEQYGTDVVSEFEKQKAVCEGLKETFVERRSAPTSNNRKKYLELLDGFNTIEEVLIYKEELGATIERVIENKHIELQKCEDRSKYINLIEKRIKNVENQINVLKKQKENRLNYFGDNYMQVLDAIYKTNYSKFKKKPIGPIGLFVRIPADLEEYAPCVENVIHTLLSSYIVRNYRDQKLLREILDNLGYRNVKIAVSMETQRYNIQKPSKDILKIENLINVENKWYLKFIQRHKLNEEELSILRNVIFKQVDLLRIRFGKSKDQIQSIANSANNNDASITYFTIDGYRVIDGKECKTLPRYQRLYNENVDMLIEEANIELTREKNKVKETKESYYGNPALFNSLKKDIAHEQENLSKQEKEVKEKNKQILEYKERILPSIGNTAREDDELNELEMKLISETNKLQEIRNKSMSVTTLNAQIDEQNKNIQFVEDRINEISTKISNIEKEFREEFEKKRKTIEEGIKVFLPEKEFSSFNSLFSYYVASESPVLVLGHILNGLTKGQQDRAFEYMEKYFVYKGQIIYMKE